MSIRTLVPAAALLALAAGDAAAQPVAPTRPRASAFQTLFGPGSQVAPNFAPGPRGFITNPAAGNASNQLTPQQAFALNALAEAYGGQPVTFNNLGHWYSEYYGHWYPGGVRNGGGVLNGAAGGGGGGGFAPNVAGTGAGMMRGGAGTVPGVAAPPALGLGIRLGGRR